LKIRNWSKFQPPMKDRNVIWIKVYRQILEDYEWHNLNSDSKATLLELLLLASENNGELPEVHKIAFRLRKTDDFIKKQISLLSHWLQDDNNLITTCEQNVSLEESREREEKNTQSMEGWDYFYKTYPNKKGVTSAEKKWVTKKCAKHIDKIKKHLNYMMETEQWKVRKKIPYMSTYVNQERWNDPIEDDEDKFWETAK